MALVLGGSGVAPAMAQAKTIVWDLPHVAAPTYYHIVNYNAFAAKVKEKSGGRMEIRVHPASSLYPQPEIIPALVDGRAEIGPIVASYLTDILLELGSLDLPFMTGSVQEHRDASRKLRPFYEEMAAKKGLRVFSIGAWPSQQVGLNLFVIQGLMRRATARDITLGTTPFVVLMIVLVAILFFFPGLALWLPQQMTPR